MQQSYMYQVSLKGRNLDYRGFYKIYGSVKFKLVFLLRFISFSWKSKTYCKKEQLHQVLKCLTWCGQPDSVKVRFLLDTFNLKECERYSLTFVWMCYALYGTVSKALASFGLKPVIKFLILSSWKFVSFHTVS